MHSSSTRGRSVVALALLLATTLLLQLASAFRVGAPAAAARAAGPITKACRPATALFSSSSSQSTMSEIKVRPCPPVHPIRTHHPSESNEPL